MRKDRCGICGYVYDEEKGIPELGIDPGTKMGDLPLDFACPVCGADQEAFEPEKDVYKIPVGDTDRMQQAEEGMSFAAMSVLFSNAAKGCEKQYKMQEKELFMQLSDYYKQKAGAEQGADIGKIGSLIDVDINNKYENASAIAAKHADRGALRALVWGEKVAKIQSSVIKRYAKQADALLADTKIYVCDICGFIHIGDDAPDICPVCKVPKLKISMVGR